jgi:hypothetical protein
MNSPFAAAWWSDMVRSTTWESNSAGEIVVFVVLGESLPARQPHANNLVVLGSLVSKLAHRVQRVHPGIGALDPHLLAHGDAQSVERVRRPNSAPCASANPSVPHGISLLAAVLQAAHVPSSVAMTYRLNIDM